MLQNSRKTSSINYLRAINNPIPVLVKESTKKLPKSLVINGYTKHIAHITDIWEINDEWWRSKPISRLYYQAITQEGRHITIFNDLIDNQWYQQTI